MTGLENIVAIIEQSAKEQSDALILEATQKADEIVAEAQKLAQGQTGDSEKNGKLQAEDIINRGKSTASLETRKTLLFAKQAMMKEIIEEAKGKLDTLETEEYFNVLVKLFNKFSMGNEGIMYMSQKDLDRLPSGFSDEIGTKISDTPKNIKNGFILTYGEVDINCTFDAIFDDAKEELQDKVSSMLF